MVRRELVSDHEATRISLALGGAAAWPLPLSAQQPERVRRIGILQGGGTEDDPEIRARNEAFVGALQQLGWIDGRNVRIEYRWAGGDAGNMRKHAAELAALAPDVILTGGSAPLAPLQQATRTVPIVFAFVPDPDGAGFVESLARPGGNITGFMQGEYNLAGNGRSC